MKKDLNGRLYGIVDELVCRGITLKQARREFERQFITATLRSHDGNLTRAARDLGVHRNTLRNKVSNLGIEPNKGRGERRAASKSATKDG